MEDYYLSNASPLGIAFHNFRKSSGNAERNERFGRVDPVVLVRRNFLRLILSLKAYPYVLHPEPTRRKKLGKIRKELPDGEQQVEPSR